MKSTIAQVERSPEIWHQPKAALNPMVNIRVDRLEWRQCKRDLLLLPFFIEDRPNENTKAVIWY